MMANRSRRPAPKVPPNPDPDATPAQLVERHKAWIVATAGTGVRRRRRRARSRLPATLAVAAAAGALALGLLGRESRAPSAPSDLGRDLIPVVGTDPPAPAGAKPAGPRAFRARQGRDGGERESADSVRPRVPATPPREGGGGG